MANRPKGVPKKRKKRGRTLVRNGPTFAPRRPWHIYVIGPVNGHYKIGYSGDPQDRWVRAFKTLPGDVQIRTVVKTCRPLTLERFLHAAFRDKRGNGEWFRLSAQEIDLISEIKPYAFLLSEKDTEGVPDEIIARHERNAIQPTPLPPGWKPSAEAARMLRALI